MRKNNVPLTVFAIVIIIFRRCSPMFLQQDLKGFRWLWTPSHCPRIRLRTTQGSDIPKKAGAVERACRGSNQARRATLKCEGWRGSFRRHSIRSTRAPRTIPKPRHVREPSTYPNSRSKPMPYKGPQRADSERIAIHFSSLLKDSRCYLISFIRLSFLAKTAS